MDSISLKGLNVLLTGASGGIGPAIAARLAAKGTNLGLAGRLASLARLENLAARLQATPGAGRQLPLTADLAAASERERLLDDFKARLGPVDILINNAGVELTGEYARQPIEDITHDLQVNLEAPLHLARLVLPEMLTHRKGWIINHASLAGKIPPAYSAVYAATKAGLIAWTTAVRGELRGSGVQAACLVTTYVSEAGMHVRAGVPAPRLAGEVSPERVAAAVVQAINGRGEVLVTNGPMRLLLALRELLPWGQNWLFERVGMYEYFKKRYGG